MVILSPTIAGYTGIISGTIEDTSGQSLSYSLLESGIVIKKNGKWLLLGGQSSLIPKNY